MSFIDDSIADRLGGKQFGKEQQIYKFELIKRAKAAVRMSNPDIRLIDMGVGEPDWPADESVVESLSREAGKPENRFYADNGIDEFKEAAGQYLSGTFHVGGIDCKTQIIHGIGSKPVLAMLPLCFINPGDILLSTTPGYPVSSTYTKYLGGQVLDLPLLESNAFLPDLAAIPKDVLKKAKALYINYPNNPTGAVASPEFFKSLVEFAERNRVIIVHDAAYASLTYDGYEPQSFLSIEGAADVGVEVHSLSKSFNMTGWRIGFICGNTKLVQAYGTIKDNTDSGQFRAIQKAAITALQNPDITERTREKYSRRFNLLVAALNELGFAATKPKGSFFCYVKAPIGTRNGDTFRSATEFSDFLIRKAAISTVPWDDAGSYVRFSVTFEAESREDEVATIDEVKARISGLQLRFE